MILTLTSILWCKKYNLFSFSTKTCIFATLRAKTSIPTVASSTSVVLLTPYSYFKWLVSSGGILTSWEEGASLVLVGPTSSDGIMIKMPYEVDALH